MNSVWACFFCPMNKAERQKAVTLVNRTVEREGAELVGWRDVPVNADCLGENAEVPCPSSGSFSYV